LRGCGGERLAALKERATLVTAADHGAGVAELIDRLVANDLSDVPAQEPREQSTPVSWPEQRAAVIPDMVDYNSRCSVTLTKFMSG